MSELAEDGQAYEGRSEATWTLPAVTSILTGKSPTKHGVTSDEDRLRPGIPTLPQYFRYEGWRTVGIVANPWFTRRRGLDVGFDYFYNMTEDGSLFGEVALKSLLNYLFRVRSLNGGFTLDRDRHPSEPLIADYANERVEMTPKPVFLMVHTQGVHSPYHPPAGWNRHSTGLDDRKAAYLNLVEFVVAQLGRFLQRLEDDALIIVTSDHGEALGESNTWGHRAPELSLLYDVPLVINRSPSTLSNPVTHLEVHQWLREEIAPRSEDTHPSPELQDRLEALGYTDGQHSVSD